jgi:hypothetical protein
VPFYAAFAHTLQIALHSKPSWKSRASRPQPVHFVVRINCAGMVRESYHGTM